MQQEGIRSPENVKKVMTEVYRQQGNVNLPGSDPRNQLANLVFSEMSRLSIAQTEKLKDAIFDTSLTQKERDKKSNGSTREATSLDWVRFSMT